MSDNLSCIISDLLPSPLSLTFLDEPSSLVTVSYDEGGDPCRMLPVLLYLSLEWWASIASLLQV